jgi:hypothetical protein
VICGCEMVVVIIVNIIIIIIVIVIAITTIIVIIIITIIIMRPVVSLDGGCRAQSCSFHNVPFPATARVKDSTSNIISHASNVT